MRTLALRNRLHSVAGFVPVAEDHGIPQGIEPVTDAGNGAGCDRPSRYVMSSRGVFPW